MNQRVIPAFLLFCTIALGIVAGTGCANIIPPSGGPRDSLPPRLVSAVPMDSALNFKGSKMVLTFDEFINVENVQQQLIVSPIQQTNPVVDYKLKTVTIRLKDSLEENTTYSFNFGEAIKDVNEGNSLKGFTYVFSTGPYLDTLTLSGKVILAENGKIDSTLLVILHRSSDDSAVINNKPRYISRLNNSGNFTFKNLPAGDFYLYALQDESGIGKLLGKDQLFAFADSAITVTQETKAPTLYAYKENATSAKTAKPISTEQESTIKPNTNLQQKQLELVNHLELTFDTPLRFFDSSKTSLKTDSTFLPVSNYRWTKDNSGMKYSLETNWKENTLYHLILNKEYAEDTLGRKPATTDTISFTTRKESEYGLINLRLRDLDLSKNPVLLFILNNTIVQSVPMKSDRFQQKLFKPGEYELRIVNDVNNNGSWDAGDFFNNRKQPERVIPIDRKINIKANWDNEIEIIIPPDINK